MTDLRQSLINRIQSNGPIPLSEFIDICLLHPEYGYYTTRDPFGTGGDFITAPEISQMFGELVGLSLAQAWLDQGAVARFTLAEMGPGRGTMMADILRATRSVPGFHDALQITLLEASDHLRARQKTTLSQYDVTWATSVDDLPDQPLFLIANEFFDALPIRQMQRDANGWRERCVGLSKADLSFGLNPVTPFPALDHRLSDTKPGDIVEFSAAAQAITGKIGGKIARFGGVALIIDYGDWRSLGDTFQALQQHQPVDPLVNPGMADLTAHVDFEALAQAAAPASHSKLTTQGVFLERLGITQRAQALASNLRGEALSSHINAHRRLTHPQEMGTLFKTLALFPQGATPPPGFEQ